MIQLETTSDKWGFQFSDRFHSALGQNNRSDRYGRNRTRVGMGLVSNKGFCMRLLKFCMGATAFLVVVNGSAFASTDHSVVDNFDDFLNLKLLPPITMVSLLISFVCSLYWLIERAQSGGSVMSFFLPALLPAIHAGIFGIGLILGDWSMFNISLFLASSIATVVFLLLGCSLSQDLKDR